MCFIRIAISPFIFLVYLFFYSTDPCYFIAPFPQIKLGSYILVGGTVFDCSSIL